MVYTLSEEGDTTESGDALIKHLDIKSFLSMPTKMDLASVRITEDIFGPPQEQFREVSSDWNVTHSIFRNEEALRNEA